MSEIRLAPVEGLQSLRIAERRQPGGKRSNQDFGHARESAREPEISTDEPGSKPVADSESSSPDTPGSIDVLA